MRNWGTIVTGFYILIVAGLSPVFGLFALNIGDRPLFEHLDWYLDPANWRYWSGVALLGGGPLVLFVVGVDTSRRRLKPRRHILVSAAAAGLALTLLVVAVIANVIMAIPRDVRSVIEVSDGDTLGWIILAACLGCWLLWALVLWRMGERLLDPATRVYRLLVAGSVLELLIALPSHVIVRQRNECSAPEVTSLGVATGLAILMMSLGPGALFLYRARMRRLSSRSGSESPRSYLEAFRDGGHP
jgi:hypothetical protein